MAELNNIWDGQVYYDRYPASNISNCSIYENLTSDAVYYIVPLLEGHEYRIKLIVASTRFRLLTTQESPNQTSSGIRNLSPVNSESPSDGDYVDFRAGRGERFLMIYVSNTNEEVPIGAYDMSMPDYYYLIESDGNYYKAVDDSLSPIDVEELSGQTFLDHGALGIPPKSSLFIGLVNPKILAWGEFICQERIRATVSGTPSAQYIYDVIDLEEGSIDSIESFEQTSTGTPIIAFSPDGIDWYSYVGGEWISAGAEMEIAIVTTLTQAAIDNLTGGEKLFHIRIKLSEGDCLEEFKINYKNTA